MLKRLAAAALLAAGALAMEPADALAQATPTPGLSVNVTPYLWLPMIGGTLNYRLPGGTAGSTSVGLNPSDYLGGLNFASMGTAEVRYDRFSVLTDVMYVNLSSSSSHLKGGNLAALPSNPVTTSADLDVSTRVGTGIWTAGGGYTLLQGEWGHVDALAGFRLLFVDAKTNHNGSLTFTGPQGGSATVFGSSGSLSLSRDVWNGIAGLRGRIQIPQSRFFIPFYGDVGGGGSDLTYQVSGGIGYQAGWADLSLGWRYLAFNQSSANAVKSLSLNGPYLAATFKF
jgi:hypothetical protein